MCCNYENRVINKQWEQIINLAVKLINGDKVKASEIATNKTVELTAALITSKTNYCTTSLKSEPNSTSCFNKSLLLNLKKQKKHTPHQVNIKQIVAALCLIWLILKQSIRKIRHFLKNLEIIF